MLSGRSLFCLGLLVRYGNELMVASGNQNVHALRSVSLLKRYLLDEDFGIKIRSLQALGFVIIARPEYMLEKDIGKILEATLSSDCDARLKMQSLQNLYEYVLDTESQMGTDNASNNAVNNFPEGAGHKVPVAAGAGDTNICGGIVQLYWNNILARCLDATDQVRQSALKIVEVVLRQGLVHPITAVPYLIALETDPQEVNSKLAHHLLMNMNEKYPAFFESRLGDGLQMSFGFIQSLGIESSNHKKPGHVKGKSDNSVFGYSRLGISRIYRLIRGNRNSRNKFISSVIRKFDSGSLNRPLIPFLVYCTEVLASLPFTLPDEPLYLIYTINRVIQVRAGPLEAEMKALSSHFIQVDTENVGQENGLVFAAADLVESCGQDCMQQICCEAKLLGAGKCRLGVVGGLFSSADMVVAWLLCPCGRSSMGNGASEFSVGASSSVGNVGGCVKAEVFNIDMKDVCHAAISLQLLLKLKRHLKIVYSLNDARCQAFSPNEPVKPGETLSKQSIPFNINETPIVLPTSYREMIEKYQVCYSNIIS
ncbi:hypothetical protein ACLOJK_003952 [Asimina triloba]